MCVCVKIYFLLCSDDDDVGLHVLGCRVDILGTNCTTADSFFIHCNKGVCWNHHVCLHVQLCPDFFLKRSAKLGTVVPRCGAECHAKTLVTFASLTLSQI